MYLDAVVKPLLNTALCTVPVQVGTVCFSQGNDPLIGGATQGAPIV